MTFSARKRRPVLQKSDTNADKSAFAARLGFCPLHFVRRSIY
jgi:hypothetical protein